MKRGDEIILTVEGFAFEGKSVGRVNGLVVFVHGAVPGDQVRVRLSKVKKSFCEGVMIDVLVPSPVREKPRCRYFGVCGGCKWQQVQYASQIEFKRQHVVDALERIGGFAGVAVNPTLGAEESYFYRNKMEFSFGDRWLTREEMQGDSLDGAAPALRDRFALGLHIPERFDKVLDVEECWLQSEISMRIVNAVRTFCRELGLTVHSTHTHNGYLRNLVIRQSTRTGEMMVNLVTFDDRPEVMRNLTTRLLERFPGITTICNNVTERKSQVATGDHEVVYHGPGYITEKIGRRTYRISANSFFQTNTAQAERLYDTAMRMAEPSAKDIVYDLYSGTGTIALHLAGAVREVIGIESGASAVKDAERNAAANGVGNSTFILGDMREILRTRRGGLSEREAPRAVIIDPPRAGMHEDVVRSVLALNPERIVYVSCNPATQARDLRILCERYAIREVQPVDMFPHTYHIETVVALSR